MNGHHNRPIGRSRETLGTFVGQIKEQPTKEKLDLVDRKILHCLCQNARFSDTGIARTLKIPREVVAYRIKRMMEKDFLHGFLTLVDTRRLGFCNHVVDVKLQHVTNHQKMIRELCERPEITRVRDCGGSFDLNMIFTTKTLEEFDEVFTTIVDHYAHYIKDYVISTLIEEDFTGIGFLLDDTEKKKSVVREHKGSSFQKWLEHAQKTLPVVNLDTKDKVILNELKLNARISLVELSEKVKLAVPAVENRIRKLITECVITKFFPLASLAHLGYQWHKVFLQVKNIDQKKFVWYLYQHPHILWYMKLIGKWNYRFSIFAKDNTEFNRVLNDIRTAFADNIISYESIIIFNQHKFVHRLE